MERSITIRSGSAILSGDLRIPDAAIGVVLFAHGSGSSRYSPRNRRVAETLTSAAIGTLLLDLLTATEERKDESTAEFRFNVGMLSNRLQDATAWLHEDAQTMHLPIGYFGASTGAAAALLAAAKRPEIAAVVSRGGRPDLAGSALRDVKAPTLLIVGGKDEVVLRLNEQAYEKLRCEKQLQIIPGATHLFQESGALDQVAIAARNWFRKYLAKAKSERAA
jgi:putative phosphoribosyl transferase